VIKLAQRLGWAVFHARATQVRPGKFITAVAGDGVGFVDLVMVRDRVLFVELKTNTGAIRERQKTWISKIRNAKGEVYLWRPKHWDLIVKTLTQQDHS
jgi:hypothetical protein